ncbi:MAG: PIN domain-containing protein [Thermococcus sp.]|nr:PIN domain-containing protein [Thermococcus sp.]
MVKVFIDTNTIVHWLVIKKMVEEHGNKILEKYKRLKQSYEFIEAVLSGTFENAEFYISRLTLAEMTKALVDFIVYEKMRLDGVAAIYGMKYFKDYLLADEEFDSFLEGIIEASNVLQSGLNVLEDDLSDLEYYPFFVARAGLRTQDAILLTTAIRHEMNYFVTMDRDFHDLLKDKRIKERTKKFFEDRNFRIVKPGRMMQILEEAAE